MFQANVHDNAIRWQYLIGIDGTHIEYPAHIIPAHKRRHWIPFLNAALKFNRRVLILLDLGFTKFFSFY